MANEGLRPYWYDSSIIDNDLRFALRFYYPADINTITILNKTTGNTDILNVEKETEGNYLYIRSDNGGGVIRNGSFNDGNIVIYDQRQEKPVYSNRISKR